MIRQPDGSFSTGIHQAPGVSSLEAADLDGDGQQEVIGTTTERLGGHGPVGACEIQGCIVVWKYRSGFFGGLVPHRISRVAASTDPAPRHLPMAIALGGVREATLRVGTQVGGYPPPT
jgi:hypothetical protein